MKIAKCPKVAMSVSGHLQKHSAFNSSGTLPPSPWRDHILELGGIAGHPIFSWRYAAQNSLVSVVQLLNDVDAGNLQPCGKLRRRFARLFGDLGEYAAGAHADADFIVEADGAVTVTANIDEVQHAINKLDEQRVAASRHRSKLPRVVIVDRASGEGSEVAGLSSVFLALAQARVVTHEATNLAAWLARRQRLNAMCESGYF